MKYKGHFSQKKFLDLSLAWGGFVANGVRRYSFNYLCNFGQVLHKYIFNITGVARAVHPPTCVIWFVTLLFYQMVELVGGRSVVNGAYQLFFFLFVQITFAGTCC